ncbi:hypothetical protein B1813_22845 [Saccharomonospora piscinae]|uniref:TraD/TraG TraM recognition site domain-containing protein n=1 Tax=Saccharomonospora piscinae TaxID=687388 RepID=A0A1V8ZW24_SACPI|nr:TraM recognition domain-containing protein [Saccharomonospora piscinae]OQO88993.1 hypothetical protein B1813_22845 [Saccharomonospora piscinae]
MEQHEYRARRRERAVRVYGGAAASLAGADLTSGLYWLDVPMDALVDLPWHGGATVLALSTVAVGASFWTRQRRTSLAYQRQQVLHAREWAGRTDRRKTIGLAAARAGAAGTRPDLTRWEALRAPAAEVGIPVGTTVSGPRSARGHEVVISWDEGGALVLGEPGSRKSTFLASVVVGAPGAQVVVSTKPELMEATWLSRAARGPVYAFAPLCWDALPEGVRPLRWSLVAGCADPHVASRRARALMEATASAGLANSSFWEGKGRAVLTALLCAADLAGVGLRTLARWLQEERYSEAVEVLDRWSDRVEESMISTLRQMTGAADRTASSVSHTASAVLEFLQDSRVATALDADRDEALDLHAFVRAGGTLYMVTDNSPALGPVMAAIWDSIVTAAKDVAMSDSGGPGRHPRLQRPLLLTADEVDKTMPGVPLDDYAAELRGWGIFTLAATQNRARLVKRWGQEGAAALCNSLQVHVILSINSGEDRAYYEKRIGTRRIEHVNVSTSAPSTLAHRLLGNPSREGHSQSTSASVERAPLWSAEMWSYLERGHALVVPTRGAAAVVSIPNGWKNAELAGQKAAAAAEAREFAQAEAERRAAEAAKRAADRTADVPQGGELA